MKYDVVLIEADPDHSLGDSCLRDLYNFTQYLHNCSTPVYSISVFTSRELSMGQRAKFAIPGIAIFFCLFRQKTDLLSSLKKLLGKTLLVLISGHGGQMVDHSGDEIDGLDSREEQCLEDFDPTDKQAEVLVIDHIPTEHIKGVFLSNRQVKKACKDILGDTKVAINGPDKGVYATRLYRRKWQ